MLGIGLEPMVYADMDLDSAAAVVSIDSSWSMTVIEMFMDLRHFHIIQTQTKMYRVKVI